MKKQLRKFNLTQFEDFIEGNFEGVCFTDFDFYFNMEEVMERMKEYVCDTDHFTVEDILNDNAGLNTIFWELDNGCVLSERFSDKQYILGELISIF